MSHVKCHMSIMYAILISIALAIYSLILIDFTLLFQEISVNADIVTSTQALYTAEGALESTFSVIGTADLANRNIEFIDEKEVNANNQTDEYLLYNEGANSFYIDRKMSLDESDMNVADGFNPNNRVVTSGAYLADGQTMDQKSYYGLEPQKSRSFVLREIDMEDLFSEIGFEYNQGSESSDLLFEVFIFPREGADITFDDFDTLKDSPETSDMKRVVINTRDIYATGLGSDLNVHSNTINGNYKNEITISGFRPSDFNYILHFQTLDNEPIHFKLYARNGGQYVMLPNMMQTIDIIGATSTGLYQRVKVQRQSEEGLMPGLNFAHFSDGDINK
jgi:hypothetical protein